tara:strand:- start:16147 stop:16563 length:417 start_codon:yes stop_codon:yes gene_type:complete
MKIMLTKISKIVLLASSLFFLCGAAQEVAPGVWLSNGGAYRVSFSSEIVPIPLGTSHQWTLYILTSERAAVQNATIEIHGYHPATRQILPRVSYISPHMGRGAYVVDNMYFDEQGEWELNIVISNGTTVDAALIPISI